MIKDFDGSRITSALVDDSGRVGSLTGGDDDKGPTKVTTDMYVKKGQFFSLAVRLVNDTHAKALFNKTGYFENQAASTWDCNCKAMIKVNKNKILSAHITVETSTDPQSWMWSSLIWDNQMPTHTCVTYTYIVTQDGTPGVALFLDTAVVIFQVTELRIGRILVFIVRLASNGYLVTNDFDPKKPFVFVTKKSPPHTLSREVDPGLVIVRLETVF